MRYITLAIAAIMLTACAGLESGQGAVDQRGQRGGFFSSYTGTVGGKPGVTRIKGDTPDGAVDLEITTGSPFVVNFGEIEANTENSTTGQTDDQNTQTNEVSPETTGTLAK